MRLTRVVLVAALGAALLAGAGLPSQAAPADPVYPSAKQVAQARAAAAAKAGQVNAIQAQLAASNARLDAVQTAAEIAAEKYNGARVLLDQRTAAAASARRRAAVAQRAADQASNAVGQFAAEAYMQGSSLGGLEAFLSSGGPQDVLDRASGLAVVSSIRNRALEQASASSVVAGVLQREAARAEAEQEAAAQAAASARDAAASQAQSAAAETARIQQQQTAFIAELATLQHTSVALERQRQQGLQAEAAARAAAAARARAEAAARAAAAEAARQAASRAAAARADAARQQAAAEAAAAAARSQAAQQAAQQPAPQAPAPAPADPTPPAPRGGVSAVIDYARAQIGKPYGWGAAGPDSFDCSGLTMMAWQQAGVYLSHYTGAQWDQTSRVPVSDLRPGDLVFYGSSGPTSHHVGIYVGDGQMIEAPHAGAPVRYASIWRSDLIPYGGRP